ncbi:MAG TPA: LamG-like jellyroll fold domain-containing protein [Sedimentisphaerales bacterium]|nr:LamG-like jellyroll fold domain-containing protein [Sedimentisphaerales bacterium]
MARSFVADLCQFLMRDQAAASGYPFTMACWFCSVNDEIWQTLMCLGNSAAGTNYAQLEIRGDLGEPLIKCLRLIVRDSGGYVYADTTTGYSANIWHHACGICVSSTERHVFLDGGSKGSNTQSKNFPSGINRTGIGARVPGASPSAFFDGRIAEAAIWEAALSESEVAVLARNFCPLFVRPQSLIAYWRLFNPDAGVNPEMMGGLYLSDYNSPGMGDHPRIIYPGFPTTLVRAAGGISPLLLRAIEKY